MTNLMRYENPRNTVFCSAYANSPKQMQQMALMQNPIVQRLSIPILLPYLAIKGDTMKAIKLVMPKEKPY